MKRKKIPRYTYYIQEIINGKSKILAEGLTFTQAQAMKKRLLQLDNERILYIWIK